MTNRTLGVAQLLIAGVALVGCVLTWLASASIASVPPIIEGEPTMSSTVYDPSLVLLSLVLGAAAGVAVVAGVARLKS